MALCRELVLGEAMDCSKRDYGTEYLCHVIGRRFVHRNRSVAAYGYNIDIEYRLSQRCNKNDYLYQRCFDVYSK